MIYEIFTFGGGKYVTEILNGVVRIIGGNSFVTAIKISLMFGMFTVLFDIALNGSFTKGVKYYISFLLAYNILFVPRVDVIITDPLDTNMQMDRKVDNVPFGIAFMGHTISSLGYWLTKTFEMNFSLPNDLQYSKNGLLFGSTLTKQMLSTKIKDPVVFINFKNYFSQCISTNIQLKRAILEDVLKSKDLGDFLQYGSSGVLAYEYRDRNNNLTNKSCADTTTIMSEVRNEVEKIKVLNGAMEQYGNISEYIMGIQQNATATLEQTLIMNAIEDSTQDNLARTQAEAAATNYAITKDDLQRKQTGIIQWIQANKYLPLLKITLESMFYALFPIVVLMTMLPNGFKIFKSYIMLLVSLQMWAPLYAILNLIMTLEQQYRVSNIIKQTGDTISLFNKAAIFDVAQGIATQAGMLAWSIPILAQKVVTSMEHLAEVSGGITQAGSQSAGQFAGEVTSGNMSYGNGSFRNMSFDNTSANKHDTDVVNRSGMSISRGGDGVQYTTTTEGDGTESTFINVSTRNNDLGFQLQSSESMGINYRKQLSEAKSASENHSNAYTQTANEVEDFMKSHSIGDSKSSSSTSGVGGKIISSGGFNLKVPLIGEIGTKIEAEAYKNWIAKSDASDDEKAAMTKKVDLMVQQQKSYNESQARVDSLQKSEDYFTSTDTRMTAQRTNDFVEEHLRSKLGMSNEEIAYQAKHNSEWLRKEAQNWQNDKIFDKNAKSTMYGNIKEKQAGMKSKHDSIDIGGDFNKSKKNLQMKNVRLDDREPRLKNKSKTTNNNNPIIKT